MRDENLVRRVTERSRVEAVVLGSAQDGGLPHAGCRCVQCERARRDPSFKRYPAALGIVDGERIVMIDATNAFAEQLHDLRTYRDDLAPAVGARYGPPDTIIITHAHTGHYVGLWQLDRSVIAADSVTVLAPRLTAALLGSQEPWNTMTAEGFIDVHELGWRSPKRVTRTVTVEAIEVPHRTEWPTDTACLKITGPNRSLLYLPDIDSWTAWEQLYAEVIGAVDVAIIDGCFWEAPPRPDVPHPPIVDSLERLVPVVKSCGTQIYFTHLNHNNPVVDPESEQARLVRSCGFGVAMEGMRFEL